MSKCNITIPVTDDPETIARRAEAAIRKAGGTFTGDASAGSFKLSTPLGGIDGTYTLDAANIYVLIKDKPLFLGCGMIESELIKYLSR